MQQPAVEQPTRRFAPIVEKYASVLRVTCERLGANIFTADLEQEARRKFQQALESENENTPLSSALFRLGVKAALEAVRAAKKHRGEQVAPELTGEAKQMWPLLQTALAQLPEQRRRAVALHLMGLSSQEIGELLGWREAKARQQIERGLRLLRTKLRAAGIEYEID